MGSDRIDELAWDVGRQKGFQQPTSNCRGILESLIAPDANLRVQALEDLQAMDNYQEDLLAVFLLATRLSDPDLEIRLQAVKMVGGLLAGDGTRPVLAERQLECLAEHLAGFGKEQYLRLLEVAVAYQSAEEPVGKILKVCSYAGKALSGILNDRKLPVEIRRQAIFYCGEGGFLSTTVALKNLIQRLEKDRPSSQASARAKTRVEQEALYLTAVSALTKLEL